MLWKITENYKYMWKFGFTEEEEERFGSSYYPLIFSLSSNYPLAQNMRL
jgi:hypothetical protein